MAVKLGFVCFAVAEAYGVKLGPYPGYEGDLKVRGDVNAYLAESGNAYVTYTLYGLEDACKTTPEGVANACGIHIHEGKTCDDASAVGGHYYATDSDPWGTLGYKTNIFGTASGSVKAAIGQGEDIAGRAVVVHDSTGGRVACALLPTKLEVSSNLPLATFDSAEESTTHTWRQQNDPVMGGASSGSFSIADGVGIMNGTVAIIPRLGVPGFIKVQTTDAKGYPDVSGCEGLVLNVKSTSTPAAYQGWRAAFGSDASGCGKFFARGFKADFNAPEDDFGEVQVPFNQFTKCWDDGSGDAIETCADKPEFCPPTSRLQALQTLSIWAEGKAADVKIEIKSVGAYGCSASVMV